MDRVGIDISLRLFHPTMDPKEITRELGLTPLAARKVGERRSDGGTERESQWIASLASPASTTLAQATSEQVARLEKHGQFFDSFASSAGRAEFFIGWFLEGDDGDTISWEAMERMSKLRINLSLCVYTTKQSVPESE